jgi:hypothetical protein
VGIIPLIVLGGAVALVWLAVVRARSSEAFQRVTIAPHLAAGARGARRSFLRRIAVAAVAAVVIGVVAFPFGDNAYGLGLLLTPGLMTLAALAVSAAAPRVKVAEPGTRRSGELTRRRPWSFVPRWAFALPVATGLLLLTAIVAFGVTSSPQDDGLYRAIRVESGAYSSTSGPYPGWYYGLPVAALALGIAVLAFVACARIAASPRPTDESLREIDRVMRVLTTRVVMKLSAGTFVVYLGALLFAGGTSTMSAGGQWFDGTYAEVEPWFTLGVVELCVGLVVVVIGAALLLLAVIDVLKAPFATRITQAKVTGQAVTG